MSRREFGLKEADHVAIEFTVALVAGKTPQQILAACGRAYLGFAAEQPQLFRLMFASDLFSLGPPDPNLAKAAGDSYQLFESLVAATLDDSDDRAIKAATIAIMSSTYGFALLRMGDRLRPFMYGSLSQDELVDAVLSMKIDPLPRSPPDKRRQKR